MLTRGRIQSIPSCLLALSLGGCNPTSEPTAAPGGQQTAAQPAVELNHARMFESLEFLASDALAGRFTREPKNLGAASDFIAEQYTKASLQPVGDAYRVPFQLEVGREAGPELNFWIETPDEVVGVPEKQFASVANGGGAPAFGSVTYVGDKVPKSVKDTVAVARLVQEATTTTVTTRAQALEAAGARGVVMIVPARPTTPDTLEVGIPVVLIAESDAPALLPSADTKVGAEVPGLKVSLAAKEIAKYEPSFNTLAWIPGTELPNEVVILGAHLDHIGTVDNGSFCRESEGDTICNGADDNASGSSMVLELALAMAESGYKPRRTVVFAHFAAEELGLHGSRALANNPPDAAPFVDGKVVAMLNLDMVGRYRETEGLQVGGMSSSAAWSEILAAAGDHDLRVLSERAVTGRSDHANFYRKKIPVLFFFTGLHDDYHGVGDHADKINQSAMAGISQIVLHVLTAVADGAEVSWSEPRSDNEGVVSRLPASDPTTVEP